MVCLLEIDESNILVRELDRRAQLALAHNQLRIALASYVHIVDIMMEMVRTAVLRLT